LQIEQSVWIPAEELSALPEESIAVREKEARTALP
jgi:hypothetical protein